jgi:hypothetical protein
MFSLVIGDMPYELGYFTSRFSKELKAACRFFCKPGGTLLFFVPWQCSSDYYRLFKSDSDFRVDGLTPVVREPKYAYRGLSVRPGKKNVTEYLLTVIRKDRDSENAFERQGFRAPYTKEVETVFGQAPAGRWYVICNLLLYFIIN